MAESMTLLCLPYAGASASVYASWRRLLPAWLKVQPVELPGRGSRMDDPFAENLNALAVQLAAELSAGLVLRSAPRYALFGHSLGGLIAYELAHALADQGVPAALFVSGASAPSQRDDQRYRALATNAQLRAELRRLNGMPDELLENTELMEMVLPVLAADFRLCASFIRRKRTPLSCPIHVFGGTHDPTVPASALAAWQRETVDEFSTEMFDGDHFFIRSHERALLHRLKTISARLTVKAA